MSRCDICLKEDSIMKVGSLVETGQECWNKISKRKVKITPTTKAETLRRVIGFG